MLGACRERRGARAVELQELASGDIGYPLDGAGQRAIDQHHVPDDAGCGAGHEGREGGNNRLLDAFGGNDTLIMTW